MASETNLVKKIQIAFSRLGARVFRNNIGMLEDKRGMKVRYGLCTGSSDLIGWTPVVITQAMVGSRVAVFTSVEAKSDKGKLRPEQMAWLTVIEAAGGIAMLVRSESEATIMLSKMLKAFKGG